MHGRTHRAAPASTVEAPVEETPIAALDQQDGIAASEAQEQVMPPQLVPGTTTRRTRGHTAVEASVPGTARRTRGAAAKEPAEVAQPADEFAFQKRASEESDSDASAAGDDVEIVLSDSEDAAESSEDEAAAPAAKAQSPPEVLVSAVKELPPLTSRKTRGKATPAVQEQAAPSDEAAEPPASAAHAGGPSSIIKDAAVPPQAPVLAQAAPLHAQEGLQQPAAGEPSGRQTRRSLRASARPDERPQPLPAAPEPPAEAAAGPAARDEEAATEAAARTAAEHGDDEHVFEEAHDELFETPSQRSAFATPGTGPRTSFATGRQQPTAYKTGLERLPNSASTLFI